MIEISAVLVCNDRLTGVEHEDMTRQQRHLHLLIWLSLAPLMAILVYHAAQQASVADMTRPRTGEGHPLAGATGLLAFGLFSFTLLIGPLSRLSARLMPLLKLRRYFGLFAFLLASAHVFFTLFWSNTGIGLKQPLQTLLHLTPESGLRHEGFGALAFVILCVMAITSHGLIKIWLGARIWKGLHMAGYFAYALLVAHIAYGVVQLGKPTLYLLALAAGTGFLASLHIATGLASLKRPSRLSPDGWILVARTEDMPQARALRIKPPRGEMIAIFREADKVWAVAHNCPHQGGPLGEGMVSAGLITCPCHGFQYSANDGHPQKKRRRPLVTYPTKIVAGRVYVYPVANALGTATSPGLIPQSQQADVYG